MDLSIHVDGAWRHRQVAANGARFHVAEAGSGPLVLFLHGFPEFWWAWRHQLPPFAAAGFRAVAMDLRGYGGSDKPPGGYDANTLSRDVSGVVRSLGVRDAVLVGHDWGGWVAWTVARNHPELVRGLVTAAAPHPLLLRRLRVRTPLAWHLLSMQLPWVPERRMMAHNAQRVEQLLRRWSAAGSGFPCPEATARYRAAMSLWPSPHCALEYHRWAIRSRTRRDGRRYAARMHQPVSAPLLQVLGARDPLLRRATARASRRFADGPHRIQVIGASGHYVHEEAPEEFNATVLDWLARLPA